VAKIKSTVRAYVVQAGPEWTDAMPYLTCAINSTKTKYKYSPEQMMFGFELRKNYNVVDWRPVYKSERDYFNAVTANVQQYKTEALKIRNRHNDVCRQGQNKTREPKDWKVGDICMLQDMAIREFAATNVKLIGPFIIKALLSRGYIAMISSLKNPNKQKKVHTKGKTNSSRKRYLSTGGR